MVRARTQSGREGAEAEARVSKKASSAATPTASEDARDAGETEAETTDAEEEEDVLCEGPLGVLIGDTSPEEDAQESICIVVLRRTTMEIGVEGDAMFPRPESVPHTVVHIGEIEEVDVSVETGRLLIKYQGKKITLVVTETSSISVDDWADAVEYACQNLPEDAIPKPATTVPTPRTAPAGRDPGEKLQEVFDSCRPAPDAPVTKDSLFSACKKNSFVAAFFKVGGVANGGVSAMEDVFKSLSMKMLNTQPLSMEEFKSFCVAWESHHESASKSKLLFQGNLRQVRKERAPLLRNWNYQHLDFNPVTGRSILFVDFLYEKRRFGEFKRDEPTAVFTQPRQVRAALAELLHIYGFFQGNLVIILRMRWPPGGPQSAEHERWLRLYAANRACLVRDELKAMGVPEAALSIKVEEAHDDEDAPRHVFVFDVTAHVRHYRVFDNYIEYYADAQEAAKGTSAALGRIQGRDIRSVRVDDGGFGLGLAGGMEPLEARLPRGESVDPWIQALRDLATSVGTRPAGLGRPSTAASRRSRPWEPTSEFMNEVESSQVEDWIASLGDAVLMSGAVGLLDRGKLSARYCVLFGDRLDIWERPLDATRGLRPQGQFVMGDVKAVDALATGLILNFGGRRVGVHVPPGDALQQWKTAFQGLLPQGSGRRQMTRRERRGTCSPAHHIASRRIESTPPPDRHKSPERKKKMTIFSRRALQFQGLGGAVEKKGFTINTHKDGGQAMESIHGHSQVLIMRTKEHPGGAAFMRLGMSCKVNERDPRATAPLHLGSPKITGEERTLAPRDTPGEARNWFKITVDSLPGIQGSTSPRRRGRLSVTGKVNQASAPLQATRRSASAPLLHSRSAPKITDGAESPRRGRKAEEAAVKITDTSRLPGGLVVARKNAHAGSLDKLRPFAG